MAKQEEAAATLTTAKSDQADTAAAQDVRTVKHYLKQRYESMKEEIGTQGKAKATLKEEREKARLDLQEEKKNKPVVRANILKEEQVLKAELDQEAAKLSERVSEQTEAQNELDAEQQKKDAERSRWQSELTKINETLAKDKAQEKELEKEQRASEEVLAAKIRKQREHEVEIAKDVLETDRRLSSKEMMLKDHVQEEELLTAKLEEEELEYQELLDREGQELERESKGSELAAVDNAKASDADVEADLIKGADNKNVKMA